jgi:hypothetical protein
MRVGKERRRQNKATDDMREEVEILEMMPSSLVDVLKDREINTHDEWKRRTKERPSSK